MGCCTGANFTPVALDPLQRVSYAAGMLLGTDDFRQEQAYLTGRDERALRETLGYGVITGLDVTAPPPAAGAGQQVSVAPGLALMPDGRLLGVAVEQCANLQAWLEAELVRDPANAGKTTVHVLLRFAHQCASPVPVAVDVAHDLGERVIHTRIVDSFALDFSWTPPDASEDLALRAVVAWIRGIRIVAKAPRGQGLASFQAAVERGLKEAITQAWGDPHAPTPAMPAAATPPLPAPPRTLQIPRAETASYYAAAFEVWARLLRGGLMARHGPVPAAEAAAERALLLAAVDAKADANGARAVRQLGRPQLLHLRLLQEWALSGRNPDEAGALIGAALPKPAGASPNILVDSSGAAPDIRLDTVQDIGPDASPRFAGLSLGAPLNGLLATSGQGAVIAARPWDGDEAALAAGAPPPFVYAPGQKAPLRIEDGSTGLGVRPAEMQMLIGVKGATPRGGDYALARLVNGSGTRVNLKPARGGLELSIDATPAAGVATQVVAAGSASSPSSLTAVTNGNVVTLGTVQPLHQGAAPRFQQLSLAALPQRTTPALVGWDASSGELVQTALPQPAAVDTGRWGIRYVSGGTQFSVRDEDHVIVFAGGGNGTLALPDLRTGGISEGRVIVIKLVDGAGDVQVTGVEGAGRQVLRARSSLTLIAATRLNPPQWLVVGKV